MPPTPTIAADRCPGVLRLIEAADGLLARVRLPGGFLSRDQLLALADATDDLGDGRLELTSRGNVQVRGMTTSGASALVERVTGAGLLPTPSRDLIRNVLASPLAGIDSALDLAPFVRALDSALQQSSGLDNLSGRFLFGLDDGRGDIAALRPDVLRVVSDDEPRALAASMVDEAHRFLAVADGAWRRPARERSHALTGRPASLGSIADALVVAPPLGRLTSAQARWLAANAAEVRVTPWRSVVIPDAPVADPRDVGLITDAASPWRLLSACAGRPRCANALADVQADAAARVDEFPGRRVHWAGCDRACGRTSDVEITMIATENGYEVA